MNAVVGEGSVVRARAARRAASVALLVVALLPGPALGVTGGHGPGSHNSFEVWRGGHDSLPAHTLYRPADLDAVPYRMPIVLWGNGGCRTSNMEFLYFLTTYASYGVFIVAAGAPETPFDAAEINQADPQKLIDAMDWALRENATESSPYHQRLDANRVIAMGQSCGGYEAIEASSDPRIGSSIIWNSGADPTEPTSVDRLHAPVLYAAGGTADFVGPNAALTYERTLVPTVHAVGSGGHSGWWADPGDGSEPPTEQQQEPLPVAENWLLFTLYDSPSGRDYFLGADCGLCSREGWTVESKNWVEPAPVEGDEPAQPGGSAAPAPPVSQPIGPPPSPAVQPDPHTPLPATGGGLALIAPLVVWASTRSRRWSRAD